jgi:triosephosphate isomerase (TIM)
MVVMKPLVIANWKLNPDTPKAAEKLFLDTYAATASIRGVEVVVCPPPLLVGTVAAARGAKKKVALGAQDACAEVRGAHTGESGIPVLKAYGVSHVILGHSERRARGETDAQVTEKFATTLASGMNAVVCIGETARTEEGEYYHTIEQQLRAALSGVKRAQLARMVIAYEPVWAIGKRGSEAMQPEQIRETVLFIKKILIETYGRTPASNVRVLYGGSVKADNAGACVAEGGADGVLVGSASLDAQEFAGIARTVAESTRCEGMH